MDAKKGSIAIAAVLIAWILINAITGPSDDSEAVEKTQAQQKLDRMIEPLEDERLLIKLDQSEIDAVVEYMGRRFDRMELSPSGNREFIYQYDDGSELIFVFTDQRSPIVLDHVTVGPE